MTSKRLLMLALLGLALLFGVWYARGPHAPASLVVLVLPPLLLAAAAHHDEERMLLHLSKPDWLHEMQQAFHQCPLGISICDARTGTGFPILYANSALQHITGYPMKHLIGRTFHLLQGPDTEEEQMSRMSSALKHKQSTRVVLTNYRKNGSKFVNMLALKPVFNQAGEFCYVIGVSFDISRRGDLRFIDHVITLT